jgi:hypothetical protein
MIAFPENAIAPTAAHAIPAPKPEVGTTTAIPRAGFGTTSFGDSDSVGRDMGRGGSRDAEARVNRRLYRLGECPSKNRVALR